MTNHDILRLEFLSYFLTPCIKYIFVFVSTTCISDHKSLSDSSGKRSVIFHKKSVVTIMHVTHEQNIIYGTTHAQTIIHKYVICKSRGGALGYMHQTIIANLQRYCRLWIYYPTFFFLDRLNHSAFFYSISLRSAE